MRSNGTTFNGMKFTGRAIQILVALVLGLSHSLLSAQELRPRWGVSGGLSINIHSADFRTLPGVPNCCPRFERGSGVGPLFGLLYEFPIGSQLLFSLGANYVDGSALLSTREPVAIATGGELGNGEFEHSVDATLGSISIEPMVGVRIVPGLFARGGVRVGALLSPQYSQKEEIVAPSGVGTFLDSLGNDTHLRRRNGSSGDLPEAASILLHGVVGLEYELPINATKTLLLTPGISYALGLNDIATGTAWKANGFRISLGLKYSPLPSKEIRSDTTYHRDTTVVVTPRGSSPGLRLDERTASVESIEEAGFIIEHVTLTERYIRDVPKRSTISSSVTAVGLNKGNEEAVATVRIEEFLQTNTHPLLGYIFFAEGSGEIPSRYATMTPSLVDRFQPKDLFAEDAMGISHNVLNIIGYNLRQHPQGELTITGCNANNGSETGARALSRQRAEAVKNYLVEVWKIAPERLTAIERDLPAIPSNSRTSDGSEENRRVEITSNLSEVTDIFVAYDTTRTATPPSLRFKPVVNSSTPITSWKIRVNQRGAMLREFSGTGAPPTRIDWPITDERRSTPRFSEPMVVQLEATNSEGDQTLSETTLATDILTVQRKEAARSKDYRIEQYNLVLFDVGKSTITNRHRRTTELVRSRLKPGSQITVEGYSDRTGDDGANRRLALSRAQATATALGRNDATVIGIGEDQLLYSNDTPEGRFYCRTVQITVRTPVER
jgi:outer membrane protein OmpA-like peptidoglycan-associated protein